MYFGSGGRFTETAAPLATLAGALGRIGDSTGFKSALVKTFDGVEIVFRRASSWRAIVPKDCADADPVVSMALTPTINVVNASVAVFMVQNPLVS
jgi:hypothetical protein